MTPTELARRIDHTLLKPEATAAQVDRLCDECRQHGFFCACVNPVWVARCAARLAGARTVVAAVAGFPLGASRSDIKAEEARRAIGDGAAEIDMVVHLGDVLAGDAAAVTHDVSAVVRAAREARADALVKVILETRALTDEQITLGVRCAAAAGADFVKTSTGFHASGGAIVEHVALLRRCAQAARPDGSLRVKASGGIRDLAGALAMLEAGASRLGMSASVAVVEALGKIA